MRFKQYHREFVVGADDVAQRTVAAQMQQRAKSSWPDYILNAGDNFYWAGININCGVPPFACRDATGQWEGIFENIYYGEGLDGVQWLGVLGNHDYGGYLFTSGWDQAIGYTFTQEAPSTGRWMTPAQYWRSRVQYPDFSVDYFFVDNNVVESKYAAPGHNLCSREHNPLQANCGPQGPESVKDCPAWFEKLWGKQEHWLKKGLSTSTTDWQIVVMHFPPDNQKEFWAAYSRDFGFLCVATRWKH